MCTFPASCHSFKSGYLLEKYMLLCTFLQEFAPFSGRVQFLKKVQTLEPLGPLVPLMPLEKGVQVVKKEDVILLMRASIAEFVVGSPTKYV